MTNRLAQETSPYLLQHADNPVEWFPWGDDAFEEARRRDVPLFVSIGYSACHWCHVMAHESFEDEDIAARLNDWFVNVKVDREERPDVDAVYMTATQALTGHGGWPMSVFTTPDGEPFYAGTYWPAEPRHGMPSFPQVLEAVHEAWTQRREETVGQASKISSAIADRRRREPADEVDLGVSDKAADALVEQSWDRERGGFGSAPKFPQPMVLEFLLDRHARTGEDEPLACAVHTLDAIARGGIHDHVGGGFHRYATDADWLVPHFEKMLYDNALLLPAYAKAAVLAERDDLARVARTTAGYLLEDMRDDAGGFHASTDADSEGEEGRYFVWSVDELADAARAAGADPDRITTFFGASASGNWEGTNILHEPVPRREFARQRDLDPSAFADELEAVRAELAQRRRQRVPPGRDDKILTSWNALAVRGLVRAGRLLDEPAWVGAAEETVAFLADNAVVDGRLHHSWKDGRAAVPALLEDVALLAAALLDLWEATGDLRWFDWAAGLAERAQERFHDDDEGGFYETASDAEDLYHRPKSIVDNAQPSGNSVLAGVFARLGALTGEPDWHDRAVEVVRLLQGDAARAPSGFGQLLQAVEFLAAGPREVAIVGKPGDARGELERTVWRRPRPGTVVAVAAPGSEAAERVPLLAGRDPVDGRPAAYVCREMVCDAPVTEPEALADALAAA